jgi:RNA polymerase sigma factor (sigma-70 family)
LHLVEPIAWAILRDLPARFELDDLVNLGRIGLMQAALRYSPRRHGGTPFSAYARPRIRGAIKDGLRRRNWTEAQHESVEYLRAAREARSDGDGHRGPDALREPTAELPVRGIDGRRLLKRILEGRVRRLSPVQAAVLSLYYSNSEPTLSEVAERLGLTVAVVARERAAGIRALQIEFRAS